MLEFLKRKRPESKQPEPPTSNGKEDEKLPEPDILNDWDRKILNEGLTNVIKSMLNDFNGRLPDAILLPDTSARPLAYALLPIFRRLNERRGIAPPRCYFFSSEKPDVVLGVAESSKERGVKDTIDTMDELKAHFRAIGYSDDLIESQVAISDPEHTKISRDVMKERAQEILARESKLKKDPEIVVVDEFATETAATASEIRRAFGMPDMHIYAIFAQDSDAVQAGLVVDPHNDRGTMNPGRRHTAKFSYSGTDAMGVFKNQMRVEKYATRTEASYKELAPLLARQKKQLRDEMGAIGERVAENIEKYTQEPKGA